MTTRIGWEGDIQSVDNCYKVNIEYSRSGKRPIKDGVFILSRV